MLVCFALRPSIRAKVRKSSSSCALIPPSQNLSSPFFYSPTFNFLTIDSPYFTAPSLQINSKGMFFNYPYAYYLITIEFLGALFTIFYSFFLAGWWWCSWFFLIRFFVWVLLFWIWNSELNIGFFMGYEIWHIQNWGFRNFNSRVLQIRKLKLKLGMLLLN